MRSHIKIGNILPHIQYVGDGTVTKFPYPFPVFSQDDIEIYVDDVRQWSGYSVEGIGTSEGGSVTFASPPPADTTITLRRNLVIQRTTDFQESGDFRAKVLNDEFDYQTAAIQDTVLAVTSALRLAPTDSPADLVLPKKDERAGKLLGFDSAGLPVAKDAAGSGDGGPSHGSLTGLEDDDHPHYLTAGRAEAWFAAKTTDSLSTGSVNKYMTLAGSGTATTAARADHHHDGIYEPTFSKNSAFNKAFGTGTGDVARGDHAHALGDLDNVTESGKSDGYALVWSATNARWQPQPQPQSGGGAGGGGGLANAYAAISDGANMAEAAGPDSLRVRSADGSVIAIVGNADATYGDNLDLRVAFAGSGSAATAARSDHDHDTYQKASRYLSKTSDYTFDAADDGALVEGGATTNPIVFSPPPNLTAGQLFRVILKKTDTSANTVSVSGDDGSVPVLRKAGDTVALGYGDGAWKVLATAIVPRRTVYTTSDTWTKPSGLKYAEIEARGGGGGGGAHSGGKLGGGGGGEGGYHRAILDEGSLPASLAITVGAGGAANAGTGGSDGDPTTVTGTGVSITANGGKGGMRGGAGTIGGVGGTATGPGISLRGACGGTGASDGGVVALPGHGGGGGGGMNAAGANGGGGAGALTGGSPWPGGPGYTMITEYF